MRVVFMGTPDFASGILDSIVKAGYEVVGVVTQPDKPKGRGKGVSMPDVKVKALEYDLPVFQPAKVKGSRGSRSDQKYETGCDRRSSIWSDYFKRDSGYAKIRMCQCTRIPSARISWCRLQFSGQL